MDDLQRFARYYLEGMSTSDEFIGRVVDHLVRLYGDSAAVEAIATPLANKLAEDK